MADVLRFPPPKADEPYDPKAAALKLLRDMITAIEADTVRPYCCVVMVINDEDPRLVPEIWQTGSSHAQQVAFLEVAQRSVLDDWRS